MKRGFGYRGELELNLVFHNGGQIRRGISRCFAGMALAFGAAAALFCVTPSVRAQGADGDKVPLGIKLPKEVFAGTSYDLPPDCHPEKLSTKPRPIPLVPKGTVNVALHKKVTSSSRPISGTLDLVTDGDKEGR